MAVLVPHRFLSLATPHTGSRVVARALLDGVPGAVSVGAHHATAEEIDDGLRKERMVTAVRNPYDLVTSWWRRTYAPNKWANFIDFVREWDDPLYVKEGRMFYHWRPGVQVLRFEELQRDLNDFLARYGFEPVRLDRPDHPGPLPWPKSYDEESYAAVNERFGEEIVAFGYEMRG